MIQATPLRATGTGREFMWDLTIINVWWMNVINKIKCLIPAYPACDTHAVQCDDGKCLYDLRFCGEHYYYMDMIMYMSIWIWMANIKLVKTIGHPCSLLRLTTY